MPFAVWSVADMSAELAFYAINPKIQVIAPWRLPEFCARFQVRPVYLTFKDFSDIPA